MEKPMVIICGPTTTGKTALGIHLCQRFGGEIISSDSRQVYRGMDIGTGKTPSDGKWGIVNGYWMIDGVRINLYDVVDPQEQFSAYDLARLATVELARIWKSHRLPFVVGGTGFYIQALVDGLSTLPPDQSLRRELSNLPLTELAARLNNLAPQKWQAMHESDHQNPRRLQRAIEITMESQSNTAHQPVPGIGKDANILWIGLTAPRQYLYKKVDQWVDERLAMGLVAEVERLRTMGVTEERLESFGLVYSRVGKYLAGRLPYDTMTKELTYDLHAFVRRQLTWFGKNKRICWFDVSTVDIYSHVEEYVAKWYNEASL